MPSEETQWVNLNNGANFHVLFLAFSSLWLFFFCISPFGVISLGDEYSEKSESVALAEKKDSKLSDLPTSNEINNEFGFFF